MGNFIPRAANPHQITLPPAKLADPYLWPGSPAKLLGQPPKPLIETNRSLSLKQSVAMLFYLKSIILCLELNYVTTISCNIIQFETENHGI